MAYLGKTPSQAVRSRYYFTASGGETSLAPAQVTGLSFTDANYVDVSLNGVALVSGTDYTATPSTNTISSLSALTASDVVEIVVYDTFSVFGGSVNGDFNISGGDLTLGDNDKAIFGAGSDLQIYHDGSHSYINEAGSGNLYLLTQGTEISLLGNTTAEFMARFIQDGAVELYHNGTTKLATTSTGVDVTGNIESTGRARASGSTGFPAFSHNTDTDTGMNPDGSGNIQFTTQGSEAMRITSAGLVGIGTTSPGGKLAIFDSTSATFRLETPGVVAISHSFDGTDYTINNNDGSSGHNIIFGSKTAGAESMRIDSSGRVGIGTSTPTNTSGLEIQTTSTTAGLWVQTGGTSSSHIISEFRNGANVDVLKIRGDASSIFQGNVGIGTSSPGRQLHVKSSNATVMQVESTNASIAQMTFVSDGAASNPAIGAIDDTAFNIQTGNTERMRIDSSGNLHVGKTSTGIGTAGLSLRGDVDIAQFTRDGGEPLELNRLTSNGSLIIFYKDGTQVGNIGTESNGDFVINGAGNHAGIRFVSDSLTPRYAGNDFDNGIDLGKSDARFDDVFATNGTIQTSDQQEKNTITDSDLGLDFINRLAPKSYIFNGKTRTHYGLIAQDVETVLGDISKPTSGFAGFIKSDISEEEDGSEYRYGLRYTEFVGPLIQAVKDLKAENDAMRARLTALENAE